MAREPTGLWLGFGERGQRVGLCPNTYFDSAAARSGPVRGGAGGGISSRVQKCIRSLVPSESKGAGSP